MQLIDRDKLRAALEQAIRARDINRAYDRYYREGLINAMLRLMAEPAIEERKHGHWVEVDDVTEECALCGEIGDCNYSYCPWCGAKMDGENNG